MENSQNYPALDSSIGYTEKFKKLNSMVYNLDKFIFDLKENFKKGKFRKCLRDLKDKENIIFEYEDKWELYKIKLKCLFKIIEKKFLKYSENSMNLKRIDNWLIIVNIELEKWFDYINKSEIPDDYTSKYFINLQFLTKSVLEHLQNSYLYFKKEKKISDSAAMLALAEKIIKQAIFFTNDPDIIHLSCKILLSISALHISDNNFELAKLYATNSLRLSNVDLKMRVNISEEDLNLKNLNPQEKILFEKIGANFSIAFYHLGVCQENLGNILKAIESYKQCKWFANNFFSESMSDLIQFFSNIEKRAIEYENFLKEVKSTQTFPKKKILSEKTKKINMRFCRDDNLKYEETLKFLDRLELHEFDIDNTKTKSEYAHKLLSTVHLVNNLMSERFRDITQIIPQHISNLSKETQEKIQKRLNEIKSEKIYFETESLRKTIKTHLNKNLTTCVDTTEANQNFLTTSNIKFNNNTYHSSNFDNVILTIPSKSDETERDNTMRQFNEEIEKKQKNNFFQNATDMIKTSMKKSKIKFSEKKEFFTLDKNMRSESREKHRIKVDSSPKENANLTAIRGNHMKMRPSTSFNKKEPVKKFEYSKVIFEKNFQNTMQYLDKYIEKEFNFQKQLLKLKSSENIRNEIHHYDPTENKNKFESFYKDVAKNYKINSFKTDSSTIKKKNLMNQEDSNIEKERDLLLVKTLKSLSPRAFEEYCEFNKKNKNGQNNSRKDVTKNIDFNNYIQKNIETDRRLIKDLESLEKYENNLLRRNFKNENRTLKIKGDEFKNRDFFIKKL